MNQIRSLLPLLILFLSGFGCFKPTYEREHLARSVEEIFLNEYKMGVAARLVGSTLHTRIVVAGLVGENLQLQTAKLDALDKALRVGNRVAMSSDADVKYLVFRLVDSRLGTSLDLIQRFEDYRSLVNVRISQDEFQSRMILEWGDALQNKMGDFDLTDGEFLARLVASRIQQNITGNPLVSVFARIDRVTGKAEKDVLALFLRFADSESVSDDILDVIKSAVNDVAQDAIKKIAPDQHTFGTIRVQQEGGRLLWEEVL